MEKVKTRTFDDVPEGGKTIIHRKDVKLFKNGTEDIPYLVEWKSPIGSICGFSMIFCNQDIEIKSEKELRDDTRFTFFNEMEYKPTLKMECPFNLLVQWL